MKPLRISSDYGSSRVTPAQEQALPNRPDNSEFGNQIRDVVEPPVNKMTADVFGNYDGMQSLGQDLQRVGENLQEIERRNLILKGQAESIAADSIAASLPDRISQMEKQLQLDAAANKWTPSQFETERTNRANTLFGELSNQGFKTSAGENRLKLHIEDYKAKDSVNFIKNTSSEYSMNYWNSKLQEVNSTYSDAMAKGSYNAAATLVNQVHAFNDSEDKQVTLSPEQRTLYKQTTIDSGWLGNARNEMLKNPFGVLNRLQNPNMYPGMSPEARKQAIDDAARFIQMDDQKQEAYRKQREETIESDLLSKMFNGEDISSDLEQARSIGLVSASKYQSLKESQIKVQEQGSVVEDADDVVELELGLHKDKFGINDVKQAFDEGRIKRDTAVRLMKVADDNKGGKSIVSNPLYKSARTFVEDMWSPGNLMNFTAAGKQAQADAVREFEVRVLVFGQDYNKVAKELVDKARERTNKPVQLYKSKDELVDSFKNGKINAKTFNTQMQFFNNGKQ